MTAAREDWGVVRFQVPRTLADEVAGWLASQAVGGAVREAPQGRSLVEIYYSDVEQARRARPVVREAVRSIWGVEVRPVAARQADQPWVERYQASLRPLPLGEGFVVLPGSVETIGAPLAGRTPIRLVPGAAFGTGEHPTTGLCAAELERTVEAGSCWLDLGTGSGILAVIAERRGAGRVLALDCDPSVLPVARRTVESNGCRRVELRCGSLPAGRGEERFDGVVANVARSFFVDNAGPLHDALKAGGRLIASGFLREDVPAVAAALRRAGLDCRPPYEQAEWAVLTGRRP